MQQRNACLNPKNDDLECFKWAIRGVLWDKKLSDELRAYTVHLIEQSNPNRNVLVNRKRTNNHYKCVKMSLALAAQVDDYFGLNWSGLTFPLPIEQIAIFEMNNPNISVNCFGIDLEDNSTIVGPLYKTKKGNLLLHHVNLLLFDSLTAGYLNHEEIVSHYCAIKNLSAITSAQSATVRREKMFYCDFCLLKFHSDEALELHHSNDDCLKVVTKFRKDSTKFDSFNKQFELPITVYADGECMLEVVNNNNSETDNNNADGNNTTSRVNQRQKHRPCSFAYFIKCRFAPNLDCFQSFRGENSVEDSLKDLMYKLKELYIAHIFDRNVVMVGLSSMQQTEYAQASTCHICGEIFPNLSHLTHQKRQLHKSNKVRDHCHITG